jgi:hypothetical protein
MRGEDHQHKLWPAKKALKKALADIGETAFLEDDDMVMLLAESQHIRLFKPKWWFSRAQRTLKEKATYVSYLSYDYHKDNEYYSGPAIIDLDSIMGVAYRFSTTHQEMVDFLDCLIELHEIFREGLTVPKSDIEGCPTEVRGIDIGLHPQHPKGFVELMSILYGTWQKSRAFFLKDMILLPPSHKLWQADDKYVNRIGNRFRIGITQSYGEAEDGAGHVRKYRNPFVLYSAVFGKNSGSSE